MIIFVFVFCFQAFGGTSNVSSSIVSQKVSSHRAMPNVMISSLPPVANKESVAEKLFKAARNISLERRDLGTVNFHFLYH